MRVLVTGDRRWTDHRLIIETLDALHAEEPITLLIEGCATGADRLAGAHPPVYAEGNPEYPDVEPPGWAWYRGVPGAHYPADWRRYGRGAGPIRNQQMLDAGRPDRVVAFHANLDASRGTADMVRRAIKAGIPVWLATGPGEYLPVGHRERGTS
jgi:hypothetical protein